MTIKTTHRNKSRPYGRQRTSWSKSTSSTMACPNPIGTVSRAATCPMSIMFVMWAMRYSVASINCKATPSVDAMILLWSYKPWSSSANGKTNYGSTTYHTSTASKIVSGTSSSTPRRWKYALEPRHWLSQNCLKRLTRTVTSRRHGTTI